MSHEVRNREAVNESFHKKHEKEKFTGSNTTKVVMTGTKNAESTLAEKKDSSKKESSLMYFRLFPTHRNIQQRIPKKSINSETMPETRTKINQSQSDAIESITQNMEFRKSDQPIEDSDESAMSCEKWNQNKVEEQQNKHVLFGSNGSSKKRRQKYHNKYKPRQNKRQKCFDDLGEYSIRDYRNYSRNRNFSPKPMPKPISFVQPPHQSSHQSPHQSPDQSPYSRPCESSCQSTSKSTLVRVEEKMMSTQCANGNNQMIIQKVRHIMNIETSVIDFVDSSSNL